MKESRGHYTWMTKRLSARGRKMDSQGLQTELAQIQIAVEFKLYSPTGAIPGAWDTASLDVVKKKGNHTEHFSVYMCRAFIVSPCVYLPEEK